MKNENEINSLYVLLFVLLDIKNIVYLAFIIVEHEDIWGKLTAGEQISGIIQSQMLVWECVWGICCAEVYTAKAYLLFWFSIFIIQIPFHIIR